MQFLFLIGIFCLLSFIGTSNSQSSCASVVCPEPLDCYFPKQKVILPDPENSCCNITECICEGTRSRYSTLHSDQAQYKNFAERYTNCTLVNGNLEIVHIKPSPDIIPYTLDVTKHIRSVTGFVSITLNGVYYIDLSSLRLIRGEELHDEFRSQASTCKKVSIDYSKGYALFISENNINSDGTGLKGINLKSLTEIQRGDVKIVNNHDLCFVDTIVWDKEIFNSDSQVAIVNVTNTNCKNCSELCIDEKVENFRSCWGETEDLCQQYTRRPCLNVCPGIIGRCMTKRQSQGSDRRCCTDSCAGGCHEHRCYFCQEVSDFGVCESACPDGTKRDIMGNVLHIDQDAIRYQLFRYCVKECPSTLRILDTRTEKSCVLTCPYNHNEVEGKCEKCTEGGCNHICYGLDAKLGSLKDHEVIHAGNIGNFTKNCTIIEGSLTFRQSTFDGDTHCNISGLDKGMLDVFENVEEITGYLNIEHWPNRNICTFKNLKRIRGLQKRYDRYSLVVMTDERILREMCLNSLEEITTGSIIVARNRGLCHVADVKWDAIFTKREQSTILTNNSRNRRGKCSPCHPTCNNNYGCWGPDDDQCVLCKNYTDYTNSSGLFPSNWILDTDTGLPVPGHNVTRCVFECDYMKGVYATEDSKCYPCDEQCNLTCSGPGPTNCTSLRPSYKHGCKNVYHNGVCIQECPITHYPNAKNECTECSAGCVDGGCEGSDDKHGTGGCSVCYKAFDDSSGLMTYYGARCKVCVEELKDSSCAIGCTFDNSTKAYECYAEPSRAYVWIIPVALVIVVLLVIIAVIRFKCKKTIQTMRKHIGEKMVADHVEADEFNSPLSPSGTAPNTAQLRIVKDSELCLGKELGSGAFGEVYKAVWTSMHIEGQTIKIPVAVKQLKTFSQSNEIMDEAYVMASVDSPYLIRLLGISITEKVSLITQLMPLGSLLEYVRDNNNSIGSRHMLTWCTQIAKGMQYLEDKHLVHRDLAARNVLVKTPHHVKITDFGLSKMLNATQSVYFAEGGKLPIKWLAIECITERQFSHQSDVWSFGVTCWEIFTYGARPYDGIRAIDVLELLKRGERLMQPAVCTIDVYMVLVKCWLVNPLNRPRFSELVSEFKGMSNDHSRYIVIKDDPNANLMSPNPDDEKRFFERLIREDNIGIDDELMLDDPDTYLLNRPPITEPEYENQPRIVQHSNGSVDSSSHDTRLFSRNTPSAQLPTPQPQSTASLLTASTSRARESDSSNPDDVFVNSGHGLPNAKTPLTVDMPIPEKATDLQVRFNHPSSSVWFGPGRKDSEENSRYTEDPTTHNRNSYIEASTTPSTVDHEVRYAARQSDSMLYDEEEYLLPTPLKIENSHDYLDSKKPEPETHLKEPRESEESGIALANDGYMDSNEIAKAQQTHPSSWSNQFVPHKSTEDEPMYVNDRVPDHEYLNWNGGNHESLTAPTDPDIALSSAQDNQSPKMTTNHANTGYASPETDSTGIDDNVSPAMSNSPFHHSPLTKSQTQNHQNSPHFGMDNNNGSLGRRGKISPKDIVGSNDQHPLLLSSGQRPQNVGNGDVKDSYSNTTMGFDNPEYMMLQDSVSDSDALLGNDASEVQ